MTEWLIQQLIQQQGPLCLVLVTLMVMEHFFTARIGIRAGDSHHPDHA